MFVSKLSIWASYLSKRDRSAAPTTLPVTLLALIAAAIFSMQNGFGARAAVIRPSAGGSLQTARAIGLSTGQSVTQEISGRKLYSYRIALLSGQFVRLALRTFNVDVVLSVASPGGKEILQADTSDGPGGELSMFLSVEETGPYALEIRCAQDTALSGKFEVTVSEIRDVAPEDTILLQASSSSSDGTVRVLKMLFRSSGKQSMNHWVCRASELRTV